MNKKQMLANLCNALLDKNYQLFLKHEEMLEQEKIERQRLANNFQERMKEVTQDLEKQKEKRAEELKENTEIK